jgi:putative transposase
MSQGGALFENAVLVADIETPLRQESCCYGYRNMTGELKEKGWIINHKKVYRLMKEHKLLFGGRIRPEPFKRDFIRFRSPGAERPVFQPAAGGD